MKTVIVLNNDGMGHGDGGLGRRLATLFLGKLGRMSGLESIVFYNGGVKLLVEGSGALQPLATLEENGIDLVACGTCIDHFELRERIRVGRIGGMDDIIAELSAADKVITI